MRVSRRRLAAASEQTGDLRARAQLASPLPSSYRPLLPSAEPRRRRRRASAKQAARATFARPSVQLVASQNEEYALDVRAGSAILHRYNFPLPSWRSQIGTLALCDKVHVKIVHKLKGSFRSNVPHSAAGFPKAGVSTPSPRARRNERVAGGEIRGLIITLARGSPGYNYHLLCPGVSIFHRLQSHPSISYGSLARSPV